MSPVAAPSGTVVVMDVGVTDDATAAVPLNCTVRPPCAAFVKLVPVIVTTVPTVPLAGVNPVIVGTNGITRKVCAGLVMVPAAAVMTVVPGFTEVARPVALIVATAAF